MKTKLVYVVVSTKKDYYLEQTLVSMISAKYHNPNVQICLVVDDLTDKTVTGSRVAILNYVDEKIVVSLPDYYTNPQRSRYLKTTLREHVIGPYLFIDSDTIITDDLSDIDEVLKRGIDIAAVKDSHCNFNEMLLYKMILARAHLIGWDKELVQDKIHFNSGVIFVNDNKATHDFYKKWHENWLYEVKKGLFYDQLALAYTNHTLNYPIKELDGIWDCQICQDGLPFLHQAKIIHYFVNNGNGRAYFFRNIDVFAKIKKMGEIPENMMRFIKNGKEAFIGHHSVCGDEDILLMYSSVRTLCIRRPHIFKILDRFVKICLKLFRVN